MERGGDGGIPPEEDRGGGRGREELLTGGSGPLDGAAVPGSGH